MEIVGVVEESGCRLDTLWSAKPVNNNERLLMARPSHPTHDLRLTV
jgi:hypothetical protein